MELLELLEFAIPTLPSHPLLPQRTRIMLIDSIVMSHNILVDLDIIGQRVDRLVIVSRLSLGQRADRWLSLGPTVGRLREGGVGVKLSRQLKLVVDTDLVKVGRLLIVLTPTIPIINDGGSTNCNLLGVNLL